MSGVVAEGGPLFPQFRGSIGGSGRQNVHRTVARARCHIKIVKKIDGARALLDDEVGKRRTRLLRELDVT